MGKKSLFFVNSFTGGGAERVCFDLIRESCRSQEAKVVVLDGRDDYGELPENCEVLNLGIDPDLANGARIGRIVAALPRVNGFVGSLDSYDVISAHLNMSQLLARLSRASKRTLYVMHGAQKPSDPHRSPFHRMMLHVLFGRRQLVCVSRGIEHELKADYGFGERYCSTIYNPLDLLKIQRLLQQVPSNVTERPFLLAAGRLNKIKRYDRLIDIYHQGGFFERYDLVILGAGDELEALKAQARGLGVGERVHFPGFSSNPYQWMARSSAFICCSDSEAFPVGLLEALFCGARVVSADCQYGPDEILGGDLTKFLVKPIDDVSAYVDVINSALRAYPPVKESSFKKYQPDIILAEYKQRWKKLVG